MWKIKVGDYVYCKVSKNSCAFFKGARRVEKINGAWFSVEGCKTFYQEEDLELVCGFTEGQKIQCSMTNQNWKEYKFYKYDSNLAFPFFVKGTVNGFDNRIISFLYARKIKVEK